MLVGLVGVDVFYRELAEVRLNLFEFVCGNNGEICLNLFVEPIMINMFEIV